MYILQNQEGYFLSKSAEWIDGREPSQLFRTLHRDEAVNQLFEVNSRDFSLRITLLECEATAKNLPIITEDQLPPPLPTAEELQNEIHDTSATENDTPIEPQNNALAF